MKRRQPNVLGSSTHPKKSNKAIPSDVRIGHSLNSDEENFIKRRTQTVQECLKSIGMDCSADKVPKIALLGSGGGERAMLGLLGSLDGFQQTDLLDCVLYLSGVSGSTWCMASLYQNSDWSIRLESVKEKIIQRLKGPDVSHLRILLKLMEYYKEKDNFSLTDVWAALLVTAFVKEIDGRTLSQQRGQNDKDPFPIYTVIDKQSRQRLLERSVFFEISPYEAGYSLTGAFVDNAMLGSQFDAGVKIKDQPEMDMLYLQGLCGSCLADMEFLLEFFLEKIKGHINHIIPNSQLHGEFSISTLKDASEIYNALVEMHFSVLKDKDTSDQETFIRTKLKEVTGDSSHVNKAEGKSNLNQFIQLVMKILKDFFSFWFHDLLEVIFKCIWEWTWGRNYNFLYKMEGVCPAVETSETRDYEDAGLLLNSPYISVLRKERNIDLIVSLDFSDGDPFETLKHTSEICGDLAIPFPEVDVSGEDPDAPKDFYVFEGKGEEPTVIHIPLFNTVNCGADKIKDWREKYSTFQFSYSAEMIDPLSEVAAKNITNNKGKLMEEIQKIIKKNANKH